MKNFAREVCQTKIVTQEGPELPSSQRYTNYIIHTEKLPLKEIQKLAEQLLFIEQMRKYPYLNRQARLRHNLAINPIPSTVPYTQEGAPNFKLFPEEQRVWTLHLLSLHLRLPLKGQISKVNEDSIPKTHKTVANQRGVVNGCNRGLLWLSPQGSAQREQTKLPISQSFPERYAFAYFESCNLSIRLLPQHTSRNWLRSSEIWETGTQLPYYVPVAHSKLAVSP